MYYPYGGAQQPQQPQPPGQSTPQYHPQQQQSPPPTMFGQMPGPSPSWNEYGNQQYTPAIPLSTTTTTTSNTNANTAGAGVYQDPYTSAAGVNGLHDYNSTYYQTSNQPQQQSYHNYQQPPPQQQQQQQQPLPPQQQMQGMQTQSPQSAAVPSPMPHVGGPPLMASNLPQRGAPIPSTDPVQQNRQPLTPTTDAFSNTYNNNNNNNSTSQRDRCVTPIGKYARIPPKRQVDLKSAPNPRRDISQKPEEHEYRTSSGQMPMSVFDFVAIDDGNASAKFFRPTTCSIPSEERLVKDSKVSFGAVLAPLCRPLHPSEEVPIVEGRPPARCHRCRGYISCHARFTDMGRYWVCPLCSMSNEVEEAYFCNLDARNNRLDRAEKPELARGSVEYDVGPYDEYSLRDEKENPIPMRPLHYLFLIDVSQKAATTFLSDYVDALLKSLHEMAQQYPQCRVAFITYASTLHFYNVRHPRIPQLIVADVDNPFVPLPFTSLCWLTLGTDLDLVDAFLMRVPEYADDLRETDSALGAAVQVAMLVLAGQHGGHVVVSAHKAPQCGIGAIKLREQHTLYGTDKEKELLRPIEGFWKTTATTCAKQQISFDLHMFADQYCELVTLSQPCHLSNGRVHLFPNYDRETDATKVQAVLDQVLLEEAGYAGILRVRCSTGLRVQGYHGHFLSQDSHDMDLAHVQGSSTFFVEFAHEGKLEKNSHAFFQTALLYTTRGGQRRVRVHSVRMPVVTTLLAVFDADLEATLVGYIHEAVGNAVNKGLQYARNAAQERVLKMLIAYRRVCTSNSSTSLLMPSRLRLLPLYVLSLLKADALVEGTTVRIDDRVQKLFHLMTIPMHQCLMYLYPTLYAVHLLPSDANSGTLDPTTGRCIMPGWRQLFYESITSDGVYVLCDEQARLVYLWVGSQVSPQISKELFGTEIAAEVGRTVFFDGFGEKLRNVLWACLLRDDGMRRLIILHEKDRAEDAFFRQLKEENEGGVMGYDQFLVRLHKDVNKALA
ncbi:putative protein transport protein Sec24C [Trypanosoma theileri]|uniref:Protein transport protein Sec24C n=1 Tax=Trypanosoma theileri TaxID=67003 RepID=A0A1X0NMN7_9TRYP|nr:putative protein transport protein Sec24C [Trypanosoma theileri]ORC85753.1 putative protein transport protein Sec24C [Trypanosoma theileri]